MNQIVKTKNTALASFASKFNVDPEIMEHTLKTTVFKQSGNKVVTNEQMVMLMVVADQYNLNPFTKEIYAFPDKQGGIVPVVGVDGWSRLINSNKHFDGMEFNQSDKMGMPKDGKSCPEWMEVIIYRKDRSRPIVIREYLDEVYRPKMGNYAGPWQSHTKRMLRHKVMIQGARIAFGFAGIYDDDEAERIMETNREAILVEGVEVETDKNKKEPPKQSKAEAMTAKLGKKEPKPAVSEEIEAPPLTITSKDKDALVKKIGACKTLDYLRKFHPACLEFQGTEFAKEISKAYSDKKMELSGE